MNIIACFLLHNRWYDGIYLEVIHASFLFQFYLFFLHLVTVIVKNILVGEATPLLSKHWLQYNVNMK